MEPRQDYGLGDAELSCDLGGGKALFAVKGADLSVIEEFCGQADLNEINKIGIVRTVFGLVDQLISDKEAKIKKSPKV